MKPVFSFLLVSFLFLRFTPVFSQSPVKQWDARFGGTLGEDFRSLQQTSDGGYILGGSSESGVGGDKTQPSQGGTDYWIVKTNSDGIKQWDKSFGGDQNEQLAEVQQTADGGYILAGSSFSGISGDKTQESRGDQDYWIVKTDVNGVKEWDARFGGSLEDELYSMRQTSDGGYILGGYSESGMGADKTQESQGETDFWIIKTNAHGVKQWDYRFGGDGNDELHWLRQTADGGFILGGKSDSGLNGDKSQPSQGSIDYWVVKTDANGIKQWDRRFGAPSVDILFNVEQTLDGGYILGGYTLSGMGGDKSQPTQGYSDYWLVKTNSIGEKQWDYRWGGNAGDAPYALRQTSDGGYLFAGRSESCITGDKTQPSQGGFDFWIIKTDANGIKEWDTRFGGSAKDEIFGLDLTSDGGYIFGGFSSSPITGDKSQGSEGLKDYWILKTVPQTCALTITPSSISKCKKQAVPLTANGGTNYVWAPSTGLDNTQGATVIANPKITTTYTLTANGATCSTTVTVSVLVSPTAHIKADACSEGAVLLTCSTNPMNDVEYKWLKDGEAIAGATDSTYSATVNGKYKAFITVNSTNCSQTSNALMVTVNCREAQSVASLFKVEVYPNPLSEQSTISFSLNEESLVINELMDLNGRLIKIISTGNFSAGNHEVSFNRETLPAGVYLLQVKSNEGVMTKKLVVE